VKKYKEPTPPGLFADVKPGSSLQPGDVNSSPAPSLTVKVPSPSTTSTVSSTSSLSISAQATPSTNTLKPPPSPKVTSKLSSPSATAQPTSLGDTTKPSSTQGVSLFGNKAGTAAAASSSPFGKAALPGKTPGFGSTLSKSPSSVFNTTTAGKPTSSIVSPATSGAVLGTATGTGTGSSSTTSLAALTAYLTNVYTKHMPDKLATIPSTLEKYKGREQELILKMENKYKEKYTGGGFDSSTIAPGSSGKTVSTASPYGSPGAMGSGAPKFGSSPSTKPPTASPFTKNSPTGGTGGSGSGSLFGANAQQASSQLQGTGTGSPFSAKSNIQPQSQFGQSTTSPFAPKTTPPAAGVSPFKTQPQAFGKPSGVGTGGVSTMGSSMFGQGGNATAAATTTPGFGQQMAMGGGGGTGTGPGVGGQGTSLFGSGAGAGAGAGATGPSASPFGGVKSGPSASPFGGGGGIAGKTASPFAKGGGTGTVGAPGGGMGMTTSGGFGSTASAQPKASPFQTAKPSFGQTSGLGSGMTGMSNAFGGSQQMGTGAGAVSGGFAKVPQTSGFGAASGSPSPFGKTQAPSFGSGATPFGAPRK